MAGIANPGLLIRTCTTSIFNKIRNKSDTTLYFVTPDVNSNLAGTSGMQTVSLYRGANIVEDSNVIFVRDFNMPTYINADSETVYYRHHCMESHAQSLTSTITGAPGQKLYVLFIDSVQSSPTYNQVIDAFMYIWQNELVTVESQSFTGLINNAVLNAADTVELSANLKLYDKPLSGVWTIKSITEWDQARNYFKGILTSSDKDLGVDQELQIELTELSPDIIFAQDYLEDNSKDGFAKDNTFKTIKLAHKPIISGSIKLYEGKISDENIPKYEDIKTDNDATVGTIIDSAGIEIADIDYVTGEIAFKSSYSYIFQDITYATYKGTPGSPILNIVETTPMYCDTINDENLEKTHDVFTLYTKVDTKAQSILEADHDVVTPNGCWLGFCIKNDTTDLFQLVNSVFSELQHVENQVVNNYEDIQHHKDIYRDTKIVYKTMESKDDPDTGEPILVEKPNSRLVIDGTDGLLTIGGDFNPGESKNESLIDDTPELEFTPIIPGTVKLVYTQVDPNGTTNTFLISDKNTSNTGELYDEKNILWGIVDYTTGELTGDIKSTIASVKKSETGLDNILASYQYVHHNTDIEKFIGYVDKNPTSEDFDISPEVPKLGDYVVYNGAEYTFDGKYWNLACPNVVYLKITPEITKFYISDSGEATTTIDNAGNIYTAGNIESNNHYPNSADSYNIGKVNNRWNTVYTDVSDARDLSKTPIIEVQDVVPYAANSTNINIGTRHNELEASNINVESSDTINIKSVNSINIEESNTINLKSSDLINAETVNIEVLGSTKVDITSTDISLFDTAGITLLHSNKDGSEFHDGIIKFQADNGQITSGTHISNAHNTYDLGASNNRWNNTWTRIADASELVKSPTVRIRNILPYNSDIFDTTINIGIDEATAINVRSSNNINIASGNILNITSNEDLSIETKETTLVSTNNIDITSAEVKLLNNSGLYLLDINSELTKFYTDLFIVDKTNSIIKSVSHMPNSHMTYDLGSNENRWKSIYGVNSRWTNLYTDNIQSDTTDTVSVNSTLETLDIKPQADNTYNLGTADTAYKDANIYNLAIDDVKSLNANKITFNSDIEINAKLNVKDSTVLENDLEVQNNAAFESDIQVNETATIKDLKVQTASISETAEFKDSTGNYIIGESPSSLVVIGEEGVDKREENTLLGVKSAIIGAESDSMSDFTMHGIKKYLDYTADTLSQVIFVDCPIEEDDIEAITRRAFELEIQPVESNIAIVRRPIATDTLGTESTDDDITHYSYTGYVYTITYDSDGIAWSIWQAMDGNYSAKDIYFTQDFKFTGPVGVVTQKEIDDNNGYVARRATGRNLQDFMYDLFAQSKKPNVVDPTYSLSASATVDGDSEVGTYITALNWNGTFTSGSYQYGSVNVSDRNVRNTDTATGITATYKMTNSITTDESNLLDSTANSRFELGSNKIQIDTIGSKVYATVTGECTTEDSPRIPVNNLHDPIDNLRISSIVIPKTAEVKATGHRKMFYGSSDSDIILNSNNIRKLQGKSISSTNNIAVDIVENAKHVIIALPANRKLLTLVNPDSKIDLMTVAGEVTTQTVQVEGANNFTAANYTIYEYKSAVALSKNTYSATIGNA